MKDITALSQEISRLQRKQASPRVEEEREPPVAWSEDIPGASQKVKLEKSGDKTRGRFVTATQDVEVRGEILSN